VLRHRKVHDYLAPNGAGNVQIVLTECALDFVESPTGCPGGTWRTPGLRKWWNTNHDHAPDGITWIADPDGVTWSADPVVYWIEQLKWLNREMRKDTYVLGATIYCFGHDGWPEFDVMPECGPGLTQYVEKAV
jgi:hypothetical protein